MRVALNVISAAILFVAVVFALNYMGFSMFQFFGPKYEAVKRDIMINSRAYNEGTIRELYTMQRQYQQAKTDAERDTIAAAARHEFFIFPKERLPADLLAFMGQVGG